MMHRIKRIIILGIVLITAIPATAQHFLDYRNEGLNCPARIITYCENNVILSTTEFTKDGKLVPKDISKICYNDKNLLEQCECTIMGHTAQLQITYDAQNRVTRKKFFMKGGYMQTEYTYGNNIWPESETNTIMCDGETQSIIATFSNYRFDYRGNWIERTRTIDERSLLDQRTIAYW